MAIIIQEYYGMLRLFASKTYTHSNLLVGYFFIDLTKCSSIKSKSNSYIVVIINTCLNEDPLLSSLCFSLSPVSSKGMHTLN